MEDFFLRIFLTKETGNRSKFFRGVNDLLAFAVVLFSVCLGGISAAMEFEIKLAVPFRQLGFFCGRDGIKKVRRSCQSQFRESRGFGGQHGPVEHLHCRAATVIADAIEHQLLTGIQLLSFFFNKIDQLIAIEVVAIAAAWNVAHQLAAIRSFPPEKAVRKLICIVPIDFVGDKGIETAARQYLRQIPVKAERVRDPTDLYVHTELFSKIALAVQHLANKRFAGRQVAIRLCPHAAHNFPATFFNPFLHLPE